MARVKITKFTWSGFKKNVRQLGQRIEARKGRSFRDRPTSAYDKEAMAGSVADYLKKRIKQVTLDQWRDRVNRLQKDGFLYWEARWLALGKIGTPAMRLMRRERREMSADAHAFGASWNEFQKAIASRYRREGWLFSDGRLNPFAMLAYYGKKLDIEEYLSKSQRRRRPKDFQKSKRRSYHKRARE